MFNIIKNLVLNNTDERTSINIDERTTINNAVEQNASEICELSTQQKQIKEEENIQILPTGNKSRDLMYLVNGAITEWSNMYKLNYLPKEVVLRQAVSLLNGWIKDSEV